MINKLVIATANKHKLIEIQNIFKDSAKEILPMPSDIGEIIEDGNSLNALNGEPGIYSARYGGENLGYKEKMQMILDKLKNTNDRTAYFITSAVCVLDENYYIALEGRVDGIIVESPKGFDGFGYDPIFKPNGYDITYAEMTLEQKNSMSHRAIAMNKMKEILYNINNF